MEKITTGELRLAQDLHRLFKNQKDLINRRIPPVRQSPFEEIEEDPHVQGIADEPTGAHDIRIAQRFAQIRRLLSPIDDKYIKLRLPGLRSELAANRRFLLAVYARDLDRDIDLLWAARLALAEAQAQSDFTDLILWRVETKSLVYSLQLLAQIHGRILNPLIGSVVKDLEEAIAATMSEVSELIPDPEDLL